MIILTSIGTTYYILMDVHTFNNNNQCYFQYTDLN